MKTERRRAIAWVANLVCLAAVIGLLAYHQTCGPPRFQEHETLWVVGGLIVTALAPLIAIALAVLKMRR